MLGRLVEVGWALNLICLMCLLSGAVCASLTSMAFGLEDLTVYLVGLTVLITLH